MTLNLLLLLQFCPQVPRSCLCPVLFTILLHWRLCRVLIYEMRCKRPSLEQEWAQCQVEWSVLNQDNHPQKSGYTLPYHLAVFVTEAWSWSVCWLVWIHTICKNVARSSRRRIPRRGRANWCFRAKPQRHFFDNNWIPSLHPWLLACLPPHHLWLSSLVHSWPCEVWMSSTWRFHTLLIHQNWKMIYTSPPQVIVTPINASVQKVSWRWRL